MDNDEGLSAFVKSKQFIDAKLRISYLKNQLAKDSPITIQSTISDIRQFFSDMRDSSPMLYSAFRIHENELESEMYAKLKGKRILVN